MSHGPSHQPGATPKLREEIQAALGGAYAVERELAGGGVPGG